MFFDQASEHIPLLQLLILLFAAIDSRTAILMDVVHWTLRAIRDGFAFVKGLNECVESIQKTWGYGGYPKRIDEKRQTLKRKLESLGCKEKDVSQTLECQELRSRKRRKKEVDDWLGNVQRVRRDGQVLEQRMGDWKRLLDPFLETSIDKMTDRVVELFEQGSSLENDGLLLDVHPARGERLITRKMVRPSPDPNSPLKRIWDCLRTDGVHRIGVYGVEGVGKTEIMKHIHNKLIENRVFEGVYWVTITSDELNVHKLQNEIAKQVGIDLSYEEDTSKRASKLQSHWRKWRSALFLDGLSRSFNEEDIGNPGEVGGCKLIIGARVKRVCQTMNCTKCIEVYPLPHTEAEFLFKEQLRTGSPLAPAVERFAELAAQQCGGLPRRIISMAERMRGVDDESEWSDTLRALRGDDDRFY